MKQERPHILHVITGLQVGGAEMMLVKTLPKLSGYRHTVCVLLKEGPLADPLRQAGIRVVSLDIASRGLWPGIVAFRTLAREKPDLCISYLIHADLFVRCFGTLFGLRQKVVFIRNNLIGSQYDRLLRLERLTSFLVQAYFSVSSSVASEYQRRLGYPAKKFTVIPNGLEIEKFSGAQPLQRSELGGDEERPLVLMVAKFYEQKGHRYLVEGWKRVASAFPNARLLLAGEGPLRAEIEQQVEEAGLSESIRFLGVRSDVPRLLKTVDIFVFPSLFEGMSNALLEAMAAGAAIVATDIAENKEVVSPTEARLVPPRDPEALAEGLIGLLGNLADRQKLGKAAFVRVRSDFSLQSTVAKLDTAYKKLLKERKTAS